jgi:hypothetical protein
VNGPRGPFSPGAATIRMVASAAPPSGRCDRISFERRRHSPTSNVNLGSACVNGQPSHTGPLVLGGLSGTLRCEPPLFLMPTESS